MSPVVTVVIALTMMSVLPGCATVNQTRRLEARLTATQTALQESEEELNRLRKEVAVRDREIQSIRTIAKEAIGSNSGPNGGSKIFPASETLRTWGAATSIRINSLLTGVRTGGDGKSPILQIVAQPLDEDGTPLKLPGRIDVEILDPESSSDQRTVWSGEWTAEEARNSWEEGLLASGYTLKVPMSAIQRSGETTDSKKYLVIVKQTLADGRRFTDTTEITVEPRPSTSISESREY